MGDPHPRPKFIDMLASFRHVHRSGSLADVADVIGGLVKQNIDAKYFANGCALRLSYALQYGSRVRVPHSPRWKTSSGAWS